MLCILTHWANSTQKLERQIALIIQIFDKYKKIDNNQFPNAGIGLSVEYIITHELVPILFIGHLVLDK